MSTLRRACFVVVLGLASVSFGCNRPLVHEDYYRKPNIENITDFQGFEKLVATNEKDRVIGYVERETVSVKGFRELRDQWYVYDTRLARVGFVSHMGATYKYAEDQSEEFVGNFTVAEGARAMLGYQGAVKLAAYEH